MIAAGAAEFIAANAAKEKTPRLCAKGIGGGSRRRVTCGWYAKNLLRVYARMWGGCPPPPPRIAGGNSCFHTPACVPARSVDWENRVGRKNYSGVKGITRLRRDCVRLRRTHILTGFARIIPDTRPSGSLRSRKIAPGDFFTPRLPKNILRSLLPIRNKNPQPVILAGRRGSRGSNSDKD